VHSVRVPHPGKYRSSKLGWPAISRVSIAIRVTGMVNHLRHQVNSDLAGCEARSVFERNYNRGGQMVHPFPSTWHCTRYSLFGSHLQCMQGPGIGLILDSPCMLDILWMTALTLLLRRMWVILKLCVRLGNGCQCQRYRLQLLGCGSR